MVPEDDPYQILGVDPDASESQIKAAYRRAALRWHPDRNPDNKEEAEEQFKRVAQALRTISHDRKEVSVDEIFRYAEHLGEQQRAKRVAQRQREKERPIAWNPEIHSRHVSTGEAAKKIGVSWITLQRWVKSGRLKGIVSVPLVFREGRVARLWSPRQIKRLKKALPRLRYKKQEQRTSTQKTPG